MGCQCVGKSFSKTFERKLPYNLCGRLKRGALLGRWGRGKFLLILQLILEELFVFETPVLVALSAVLLILRNGTY